MTLAQLALTVLLLGALGVGANWAGISAIPAYLLAGILLGPNKPHLTSLIQPSEVTEFVAELGLVFLLFFLGLEFSLERLRRTGRHVGLGGTVDLVVNGAIGLLVGIVAFGVSFGALVLAAAIYVSSSAITVKGLIDFRRLADDETDLILAILLFEDLAIAFVLGFAATGGGSAGGTLGTFVKAFAFIAASLAASHWIAKPLDRLLDWLPREFFLLFTFALLVGMAALAKELGMSEAIGALMAGVVLSETSVRRRSRSGSSASGISSPPCSSSSSDCRSTWELSVGSPGSSSSRSRSRSSARPSRVTSRVSSAASPGVRASTPAQR
ncbi:MAG: cation:proton antiporter [Actinobacteria bacterium]|nr:cation:proton antiporter [Actinomycetota bacterium]